MKQKKTFEFSNPFSENFIETWEFWKQFKKDAFGFEYHSPISEQAAINHLVSLSDGDEEKAVKIVNQSFRHEWRGFFPLKETTHGTKQPTAKAGKTEQSLRDQSVKEYYSRNGSREQPGSGDHLKAV